MCVSLIRRLIDSAQSKCLVSAVPLFKFEDSDEYTEFFLQVTFYMVDWVASFLGF